MINKIALKTKKGDSILIHTSNRSDSLSLLKIVFIFVCFLYILLYICKWQISTNFSSFHV